MQHTVTETLKTSASSSETHNITYTYDNLNRFINETADTVPSGDGYTIDYTYDVTGNRTRREVTANGQVLITDYQYYTDGCDKLEKEIHSGPVACVPLGDEQYYAYADNGGITYKSPTGEQISEVKAFMLGLPNRLAQHLLALMLIFVPLSFFIPVFAGLLVRPLRKKNGSQLALWQRGLCVFLAYVMLIQPGWLESVAQASSQYSQISTSDWATHKYIEYTYDNNGSCITKTTKNASNETVESITYDYNLRNKLERITKEYTQGSDNIAEVTEYTYNDDGIRVESYSYDIPYGQSVQNEKTVVYLIDSYNHTGYAQTLEKLTFNKANPDPLTELPDSLRTYLIGDDIIAEKAGSWAQYLLYDGHGSVRHHSDANGDLVVYSGCDTFAYDAYGQRVDPLKDSVNEGLFYTGEQWDSSAQMYYLRARWYDPTIGRFNKTDPLSGNRYDPQSLHKYLYAHCNPVNNIDPTGKFTIPTVVVKIAIVAVVVAIGLSLFTNVWAKTEQVVVYIDYSQDSMRPLIMAKRSEIQAQFNAIVPTVIFEGPLPEGRKQGYKRWENIYRIPVVWREGGTAIGKTTGSRISLRGETLEDEFENYDGTLTTENKQYVAANCLMHEMVHAIENRNYLRAFPQHESTGLMKGFPFSWDTFSIDDSKDGLIPFSSTTVKRLKSAVGKRF
jgi:RHS repeat-associated protein